MRGAKSTTGRREQFGENSRHRTPNAGLSTKVSSQDHARVRWVVGESFRGPGRSQGGRGGGQNEHLFIQIEHSFFPIEHHF